MTQEEKIINRYRNGEKLMLSPSNPKTKVTFYLGFIGGITVASLAFIISIIGLTWMSLAIISSIALTIGGISWLIMRNYSIVSIKSGNIIVSDLNKKKNTVASLRSIRTVQSSRIGNIQRTSLNYSLDGRNHKAVILKWVKDFESDPESILKTVAKSN